MYCGQLDWATGRQMSRWSSRHCSAQQLSTIPTASTRVTPARTLLRRNLGASVQPGLAGLRRPACDVPAAATAHASEAQLSETQQPQEQPQQQQRQLADIRLDGDAELLADFDRIDESHRAPSPAAVDVRAQRLVTDPVELDLVGAGLPIINGPEWPEQYWEALKAMSRGQPTQLPRPHPKFSKQDLIRIAGTPSPAHAASPSDTAAAATAASPSTSAPSSSVSASSSAAQISSGNNDAGSSSSPSPGPRLGDLVLEHVERLHPAAAAAAVEAAAGAGVRGAGRAGRREAAVQEEEEEEEGQEEEAGVAYRYIPRAVLGDYSTEVEPDWRVLPQMSVVQLYEGVRQRNWTSAHYRADAEPWRIQLFQCDYLHTGVTGWPGWRAVVTSRGGVRQWVDLPEEGEVVALGEQAPPAVLSDLGYRHIFAQLYQAYEARYPPEVLAAMYGSGSNPHQIAAAAAAGVGRGVVAAAAAAAEAEGGLPHETPALRHLDVSYHRTGNAVRDPTTAFLIRPSLEGLTEAISWGLEASGLRQLREVRDSLLPQWSMPEFKLTRNNNNLGVIYFAVCLTLGIVIPALRRSRILDIKTLEEDPGAAMEFARSKASARKEGLTGVEFKDVAGLGPILSEVVEVVEFLKDPQSFAKLGARPPKGILMEGDPGTGKTLLAKALAGEAMVPFYQMSGTEFTEGIVGLGAARVRDLFKRARATAPCIIFVDEIDALGLKRAERDSVKTNEEREQTLNQLLTEMDGFTPDTGVVFLGATNRADLLDPALMRPGRFDRKIRMPKPDTEGRFEILTLHLRNKELTPDVDLLQLARDLPGLAGADLANIVNEAAMAAAREGRRQLTAKDLYAGVDRFTQGEVRPPIPTTHKLPVLCFAAKEIGIALVAGVLRERYGRIEAVERVSIQPKGQALSRTLFQRGTDEEYHVMTRGRMMDRMRVALAGALAVRHVLGEDTNFMAADINRATLMAKKFVFYFGFSDAGITTWANQPYSSDFLLGQQRARKVVSTDAMDATAEWPTISEDFRFDAPSPSDVTWHRYSDEVRRVIKACCEDVMAILQDQEGALWAGIKALSERKEMLGGELRDLFDEHPPRSSGKGGAGGEVEAEPAPKLEMTIFTDGENSKWPYGIEWLNDAYPIPYWVRQQQEKEKEEKEKGQEKEKEGVAAAFL